jgi:hypothetical protein
MILIIKWILGHELTPGEQRKLDTYILNIKAASLAILMAIILMFVLIKVF